MKTFIQHDIPSLVQINSDGGRVYQTPTGDKYPSVTTIMSFLSAKDIQAWRKRVGTEEANKVSARASRRGSSIHSLCENYLKEEKIDVDIFDQDVFNTLIPHLDLIDNIHCLETKLFSNILKVAGTVDCVAEYNGKLSIIDFKTSKKAKKKEWISNYFMQTAAYGMMFWELTGIAIDNVCIIMGVDDQEALIFQEPLRPWLQQFRVARRQFYEAKGF